MIQTTASQQQSSGPAPTRRKKSQRYTTTGASSSKLSQKLILNPPKPPQQQQKLTLRSSKQPTFINRTSGDWMECSLIGNGADASYHYGDICKVQAIMKIFNGSSSATTATTTTTTRVEDVERKDVVMTTTDAELDDRVRVEQEMNDILQEALDCTYCDKAMMTLDPKAMESDIRHGIYRCSDDPPFVLNRPCEEIAPDEMSPEVLEEPGYLQLATAAQQEKYLQLVAQHIERNRANKQVFVGIGMEEEEQEEDVDQGYESKFAFYCVDYHIHQHYIHRRSILNLCRTNDEMDDYRCWKYKLAQWTAQQNNNHHQPPPPQEGQQEQQPRDTVAQTIALDHNAISTALTTAAVGVETASSSTTTTLLNPFTTTPPPASPNSSIFSSSSPSPSSSPFSSPSTAASSPPDPSPFPLPPLLVLPWPKQQCSISAQITLHRRLTNPRERAARVRAAHKRFQNIMKERAIQRREGLVRAECAATFAFQRWQLGKGGPLAITREGEIGELLQRFNR